MFYLWLAFCLPDSKLVHDKAARNWVAWMSQNWLLMRSIEEGRQRRSLQLDLWTCIGRVVLELMYGIVSHIAM